MASKVLLLTGFEPFGGDHFNPSGTLARQLHGTCLTNGALIQGLVLPVSGPAAWRKLSRAIRRLRPHWIIATGVSSRPEISLESTAWNQADYPIPDNAGHQPRALPILSKAPARLDSALLSPHHLPPTALPPGPLPIRHSTDPGRYVCNHLYYRLLHLTRHPRQSAHQPTAFIHLPPTWEMQRSPQDPRPFHPLATVHHTLLALLESLTARSPRRKTASPPVSI